MEKKTKIVATISDKRCEPEFIRALYEAGMDAVRLNSAHLTPAQADMIVNNVREVSDKIAIMLDTKGPEIRLTGMATPYAEGIEVREGDTIRVAGTADDTPSTPEAIYMNYASLFDDVPAGARILIDDGEIEMEVTDKRDGELLCTVRNSGTIKSRKSVNIPGVKIDLPSVTDRDRMFIAWAIERDIDFIAHSFVRKREDVLEVKRMIEAADSTMKIISKIENQEGVDNIDGILRESYGVIVARGDLGVEIPAERIPVTQRYIVKKCIESRRPVIIATQLLHSMTSSPRPTRAEVSDIASAIYQRVDAIMLSGETANGKYPVEAVRTMSAVASEVERDDIHNAPLVDMDLVRTNNSITAQLARSAVMACLDLPVQAVVMDTMSGRTGRYIAAFRGQKPVYAVCYDKSVMRRLSISFGVHAIWCNQLPAQKSFVPVILDYLQSRGWLSDEHLLAVVGGNFGVATGASFMEIATVQNLRLKAQLMRSVPDRLQTGCEYPVGAEA